MKRGKILCYFLFAFLALNVHKLALRATKQLNCDDLVTSQSVPVQDKLLTLFSDLFSCQPAYLCPHDISNNSKKKKNLNLLEIEECSLKPSLHRRLLI